MVLGADSGETSNTDAANLLKPASRIALRHPHGHIKFGGTASNSAFDSDATFSRESDSGHLFLPECFENEMRIQEGAAADKAFERHFAKEPKAYNG